MTSLQRGCCTAELQKGTEMSGFAICLLITNLLIGCLVAILLRDQPPRESQSFAMQPHNGAQSPRDLGATSTNARDSVPIEHMKPSPVAPPVNGLQDKCTDAHPSPGDNEPSTTWALSTDSRRQLQTLRERIHYARSATDKHLSKEVARQLRAWARSWQAQLQSHLNGTSSPMVSEWLAGNCDTTRAEMCLAQIETTLSNIDAVVSNGNVDDIVKRVEQETNCLENALECLRRVEPEPRQRI